LQPLFLHDDLPYNTSLAVAWEQIASFLFLLAYFNLLLFWAEFYYNVDGSHKKMQKKFRVGLILITAVIGILSITFVVLAILFEHSDENAERLDDITAGIMSILAIAVGFGFFYYGIRLYLLLRKYRLISPRKRAQTWKVVGVAVGCTVCFLTRAGLILYSVSLAWRSFKHSFNAPVPVIFFFFFCLETVPICMMLFLLRKLPNWKNDLNKLGNNPTHSGTFS